MSGTLRGRAGSWGRLWVIPAAALAFGAVLVVFRILGVPASDLTRDVTGLYDGPPWLGLLSAAGVLVWVVGGAIALFSAWIASDRSVHEVRFLAAMGALALVIAADDQLRLTQILHTVTGVPKVAVAGVYGVAALSLVWAFRTVVRGTDVPLLVWAGALVAAATAMDAVGGRESVEDLLEFTGAVAFAAYLAWVGRDVSGLGRGGAGAGRS